MGPRSLSVLVALACLTSMLSGRVDGRDILVGGDGNWKLDFNYTAWAETEMFMVGDNLVFNYKNGSHNVQSVSGAAFKNCSTGSNAVSYVSGKDVVPLTKAGNMWFLCSVGDHCKKGMKFKITVMSGETAEPPVAKPPQSKASPSFSSAASAFTAVILACMAVFLL